MIVVADTSVVINLAVVNLENLLADLFQEVFVPPAVQSEFVRLAATRGRFSDLELAEWIQVRAPAVIPTFVSQHPGLGSGEIEALALAAEIRADAVLIDEHAGRAVAIELGLTPIGVLGILVRAKRDALLPAVAPVLNMLIAQAHFRVSPELAREVLRLAGE